MLLPPSAQTVSLRRLERLGARRISRAHILWTERPALHLEVAAAASQVASALTASLGQVARIRARLLPTVTSWKSFLPRRSVFALLSLSAMDEPAVLEVEPPLALAVLSALAGGRPERAPLGALTRVERAAFGHLVLEAVHAARGTAFVAGQFAPRLIGLYELREEFAPHLPRTQWLAVDIGLGVGDIEGTARLHVPANALQLALQSIEVSSAGGESAESALSALRISLAVRCPVQVPAADWACLSPGDVVILHAVRVAGGGLRGEVGLHSPWFDLVGALDAGHFTLLHARRRTAPPPEPMPSPDAESVTCTLPLDVQVELGDVQLSLAELHALKPGAVVSLHLNPASPVRLKYAGKTVARAELVDIDGAIGARILAVAP